MSKQQKLEKVLIAGVRLANAAFNLKQNKSLPLEIRTTLTRLCDQWDEAYLPYMGHAAYDKYIKPERNLSHN